MGYPSKEVIPWKSFFIGRKIMILFYQLEYNWRICRRDAMKVEEAKKNILGFMYAERLKSALIITGRLLDALEDLKEGERAGGLKMFSLFTKGVISEMQLAANVMEDSTWGGLSGQFNLMEGYARLGQMEAARQELSQNLSRITTLSGRALTYLKEAGLL
jgi:hypothetical protein